LARYWFSVDRVVTGAAVLAAPRPQMVLLEWACRTIDGIEVCRQHRG
jgi:hypothetical protein